MSSSSSRLFDSITLGRIGSLEHRVVMAPLTRLRNNEVHEPTNLAVEYYTQRASVPGTLIITEGIFISLEASGIPGAPGLWTEGQVNAWKKITDAVHAKGSFIVAQIFAAGLAADPAFLAEANLSYVNVSDFHYDPSHERPRALTRGEIQEYVKQYGIVARNAVLAGFDGVELHLGNGYLMDQFLQTNSNTRKDDYGGSVENRLRFALQAMKAIVDAVGEDRVGFRVTPWSRFQGMRMPAQDITETFSTLFKRIRDEYPHTAYAHVVQPRISGAVDDAVAGAHTDVDQADADVFLKTIWAPRAYIAAGGYERESALKRADATGDLIAFGRKFIANPDLPTRLRKSIALNVHDRSTFYTKGPIGYTDYPFADEMVQASL